MEWGKFPIYLTLKCINIFFCHHLALSFRRMPMRNGRLCHSDDCKEEESPLLCAQEKSLHFILSPTISPFFISRLSIHTVCDKLSERLCHLQKWLCQTAETVVQSAWHSCATTMAQPCQRRGTSMPKVWHKQSIPSTPRPLCFLCPPDGAFAKMRYIPQKVYLQKDSLSNSQTGIAAWYGWQ